MRSNRNALATALVGVAALSLVATPASARPADRWSRGDNAAQTEGRQAPSGWSRGQERAAEPAPQRQWQRPEPSAAPQASGGGAGWQRPERSRSAEAQGGAGWSGRRDSAESGGAGWRSRREEGRTGAGWAGQQQRAQEQRDRQQSWGGDRQRDTATADRSWRDRRGDGDRSRDWQSRDRNGSYADRDRNRSYTPRQGDYGRSSSGWQGDRYARTWDRNWRNDRRYDWRSWRNHNRSTYNIGVYYSPYRSYGYRRLSIGYMLQSLFFGERYWINDPWQYRLPAVYGPYRWVRYYDDVLLVNIYNGEVVDVIYDFFW